MKIFWGITASRSYRRTIPSDQAVMLSAGGLWNGSKFRGYGMIWPDWFLDSGGFVALHRWGDYPFTPEQYLALVQERAPTFAASMDYPCEPNISRGCNTTNEDRITATVELAHFLCGRDSRIIPVLQGYTIAEYAACWDQLDRKLPSIRRLAVGSLCRRQSSSAINTLSWGLRQVIPNSVSVHGFGLKLTALRYPEVRALFDSVDTNAWEFWGRGEKRLGKPMTDLIAWNTYSKKVVEVLAEPRQLVLGE